MLSAVQGVYRKGKVELTETPSFAEEESKVIVTFLETGSVDLKSRGVNDQEALELRTRLESFADDWMSSEMDGYDRYDQTKTNLPTR